MGTFTTAGPSIFFQALNPWNKTIEEVTQGLQRRREMLEREVVHADRMFDHVDRIGRRRQAIEREWGQCIITLVRRVVRQ
jgi:phage gp29-like protein